FRRLSVFAAGCTLEAAEAVCGGWELGVGSWGMEAAAPTPISQLPTPILDGLASLIDKSLLRQVSGRDGDPRFTMLETIREYALERLEASGELHASQHQHLAAYLALARLAEPQLAGPDQLIWLDRLEQEHDNLRAALAWALEHNLEAALQLGVMLLDFWY